jgi:hypothetical protein
MRWKVVTKMSIQTIAQLENVFPRVTAKQSKTGAPSNVFQCRFYDKNGVEIRNLDLSFYNVEVRGITMPFLDRSRGDKKYDVGATTPQVDYTCLKDSDEFHLMAMYVAKIQDADCAFVYGLDTGKLVKKIERIPFGEPEEGLFTPRIHYTDGTTLDVKKADLHEIAGNQRKYFVTRGNTVFFNEEPPQLMRKMGKNGNMYPSVALETPMSFTMKRLHNVEATSTQLDITKWGITVHEIKNIEGKWVKRPENIVEHVPIITKPGDYKSFVGCVNIHPSYITNVAGNKSTLHLEGTVFFIAPSAKTSDDIPVGEFQSSLPVGTKTRSKATAVSSGAAAAVSGTVVDDAVGGVSPRASSVTGSSKTANAPKGRYVRGDSENDDDH